jgi:peptide/nickel transport system ATP-binding protein
MIAKALACKPALRLADELTTALDVTIQAQVLDLMRRLQREQGMAILFITHDLGIVAQMAGEVAIMYTGRTVEHGSAPRARPCLDRDGQGTARGGTPPSRHPGAYPGG